MTTFWITPLMTLSKRLKVRLLCYLREQKQGLYLDGNV
jgi:hypothetical protein